ncbi:MAG: pseudouridine synthase [Xanthobacteraceae bacterium]|nr:pseudouridine synthase [Xanthobacteraceae bacterium]
MPRDKDKTSGPARGTRGAGRHVGKGRPGGGEERPARAGGKPFGAKASFGAKKPYGDKKPFGDKPLGDRKGGDKRPYAARPAADRPRSERPGTAKGERFGGDRGRPRADRDAGPPRSRDDRPARAPRKEFTPRGDRGAEERPRFKPREDRGGEKSFAPRGERRDARPAGRFADKKFGDKRPFGGKPGFKGEGFRKDGDKPFSRGGGFRKDGDRPERAPRKEFTPRGDRGAPDRPRFKPREDRGGEKSFAPRGERPRREGDERPRFSKPRTERPDRAGAEDRAPRKFSRPRDAADRPKFDRPRSDRPGRDQRSGDRPGFERPRSDRPRPERATFARPRADREASWKDHPRSEGGEERPRGEPDEARIFVKRPAFGGRGAYRERPPEKERRRPPPPNPAKTGERIAKRLARAGLCSRRDAEEWIMQGRVAVNGRVLTSPALDVTERDTITVDGKPLPERERTRLFLYHKPRGLMTTHADPEGRPTVFDNLPEDLPRLISVGRLDFNTEGLLLLTNDGGLARALELPETGWLRRYRVRAHGAVAQAQLDALRAGVEVDGVKYGPIEATLEREQGDNVWITFAIREGKNREVRNVLAHLGLEVNRLIRISYGPFQLAELPEGEVEEVRTRVLREQLGEKIAALANADFQLPVKPDDAAVAPAPAKKTRPRAGLIADRKGRRVLVERSGESEAGEAKPYKRPKRAYHGKRDIKPRDE